MENKREKKSLYVKQTAVSVCCYGVIFALLFYPWVVIGDASYHPFQFAMKMTDPGLEALLAGADIYVNAEDFSILQVGVWMELIFCGLFFLSGRLILRLVCLPLSRFISMLLGTRFGIFLQTRLLERLSCSSIFFCPRRSLCLRALWASGRRRRGFRKSTMRESVRRGRKSGRGLPSPAGTMSFSMGLYGRILKAAGRIISCCFCAAAWCSRLL